MLTRIKLEDLNEEDRHLLDRAREAISKSYAPYSKFRVGASVRLANGGTVQGANQENSSYPVGICAERSTLCTAQNVFPGEPVVALALAALAPDGMYSPDPVTPCGMCRQAMVEVEQRYQRPLRIIMGGRDEALIAESVADILPCAFN